MKMERERERRRCESPPEAKGERSETFAGGARDSANQLKISGTKLLQNPHQLSKLQLLGLWHRLTFHVLLVIFLLV